MGPLEARRHGYRAGGARLQQHAGGFLRHHNQLPEHARPKSQHHVVKLVPQRRLEAYQ